MMRNLFSANVKGRNILLLFIATTSVYLAMLLVTIPRLMIFSGGKKILDMMPGGYDTAYAMDLLKTLNVEGRSYYLTKQLSLDFIYPGLFALTYWLAFMFFLKQLNKQDSPWRLMAFLPVIAGIADYLENICIKSMIKSFPHVSTTVVQFSSTVSILKASATTVYFISLVVLLIAVGVARMRNRGLKGGAK